MDHEVSRFLPILIGFLIGLFINLIISRLVSVTELFLRALCRMRILGRNILWWFLARWVALVAPMHVARWFVEHPSYWHRSPSFAKRVLCWMARAPKGPGAIASVMAVKPSPRLDEILYRAAQEDKRLETVLTLLKMAKQRNWSAAFYNPPLDLPFFHIFHTFDYFCWPASPPGHDASYLNMTDTQNVFGSKKVP
jgi:hypothetical protein